MAKCCDYHSGMLRTAVSFEREARTADGAGGSTRTWAVISDAPSMGAVKVLSGGERWVSDRTEAQEGIKIVTRYSTAITEKDLVTVAGRRYNINHIENVEFANTWIVIKATGGVAV